MDKAEWGPGPWQDEPDELEFEAHGFPCMIARTPECGHLCGYVGVPASHPWHGLPQRTLEMLVDVHGGVSYARDYRPGADAGVRWWIGFDCGHFGDVQPELAALVLQTTGRASIASTGEYRDLAYVRREVDELAAQARAAAEQCSTTPK